MKLDKKNTPEEVFTSESSGFLRKMVSTSIMLAALGGLVLLGWYAYEETKNAGNVDPADLPLITANKNPYKVKPEDPGGMHIPNKDKVVYDAISPNNSNGVQEIENSNVIFMPEPEEPVSRDDLSKVPAPFLAGQEGGSPDDVVVSESDVETDFLAEFAKEKGWDKESGEAKSSTDEKLAEATAKTYEIIRNAPQNSEKLTIIGENKQETAGQKEDTAAKINIVKTQKEPVVEEVKDSAKPDSKYKVVALSEVPTTPARKLGTTRPAQGGKPINTTATKTALNTTSSATIGKGIKVQLGSYKSISNLEKGWAGLQKRFPDMLGGLAHSMETVELGSKGVFYRLHAGPIAGKDDAQQLCKKLINKNQGCLLVR